MREKDRPVKTFEELLDMRYKQGSAERRDFEKRAQLHLVGEMLREARREAGLTQEALAAKIGTKKAYISRVENGKTDIQVSGLFRIFEEGLGKRVILYVE
jgi:HTH-type transcriptional regulator/antitoxin HipB